jgi:hypothetical protein
VDADRASRDAAEASRRSPDAAGCASRRDAETAGSEAGGAMKPKKRVLLYCADRNRRNDLAFVLRIRCPWAFVETFESLVALSEDAARWEFGCIVLASECSADGKRPNLDEQIEIDWLLGQPGVALRAIEVRTKVDIYRATLAGHRVIAGDIASLAEAMRLASERKRGPKKGAAKKVKKDEEKAVVLEEAA